MNSDDVRFIVEKAIRRTSNLFGYDARPIVRAEARPIDILGLAVRDLVQRQPNVIVVQIGAHDGVTGDPISTYIRRYGWTGILVEPQPAVFQKLVENYKGVEGVILENVAIDTHEGTLTLHVFKSASPDEHSSMLASTKKHYLTLNGDKHRGELSEIKVPATTLSKLVAKHGLPRVDVLQIDTEGYDFTILKGVDFSVVQPEIIHFESNFLNRRQREDALQLLSRNGYSVLELGQDMLALRQPIDEDTADRLAQSKVIRV
jgi:FkbM family methyltransferase